MRFQKSLIIFFIASKIFAQTDSTQSASDIFVIDSFITPETPNKFVLSFSTNDSCISKLIINKTIIDVSKTFADNHKIEIELNKLKIDSAAFKYVIVVKNKDGLESKTELYDVALPKGVVITSEQDVNLFSVCLGGLVFAIPTPTYVSMKDQNYFSLNKEIPLINFYSVGYNYPAGYLGFEYSYIFQAEKKNFLRLGYKQIIQVPGIKYISPGINYFTNFLGYNGFSPELSVGFFQIQNVFTFYARYRYNFQVIRNGLNFHEISIGLYSNIFSLNL
jgi:hypothetical protein